MGQGVFRFGQVLHCQWFAWAILRQAVCWNGTTVFVGENGPVARRFSAVVSIAAGANICDLGPARRLGGHCGARSAARLARARKARPVPGIWQAICMALGRRWDWQGICMGLDSYANGMP